MVVLREDLLEDIRRVAEKIGKTPTKSEYTEHGEFSVSAAKNKFENWTEAIETAGLEPTLHYNVTEEDVEKDLERLEEELDKRPEHKDLREHGKYCIHIYAEHDWKRKVRPSREEVLEKIHELAEEKDGRPTQREFKDLEGYGIGDINRHFGLWNDALEEAGFEPSNRGRPRKNES